MNRRGYTLLELTIVLIIISLITAGMLVGQDVMHSAKLRTVMTQTEDYRKAFKLFRDKYHAWPGDFYNANAIWSAAQNGNGDERIANAGGANETHGAWQQLSLAGFIKGSYTGTATGANPDSSTLGGMPGGNVPAGPDNIVFYVYYHDGSANDLAPAVSAWSATPGNYIDIADIVQASQLPTAPAFSPSDALSIDMKMDDGQPGTGAMLATPQGGSCTYNPGGGAPDAYVATTSNVLACVLTVKLGTE